MQQRMRRAVAELNIGYRHSPVVASTPLAARTSWGAHQCSWVARFRRRARAGDRAPTPGSWFIRTTIRSLLPEVTGTTHHLVLFAGALATGKRTGDCKPWPMQPCTRTQTASDAPIVPELPEDLVGKGEILLDPRGELPTAMELKVHVCMWCVPTAISASAISLPIPKR
jgi:hypothetical protein